MTSLMKILTLKKNQSPQVKTPSTQTLMNLQMMMIKMRKTKKVMTVRGNKNQESNQQRKAKHKMRTMKKWMRKLKGKLLHKKERNNKRKR